MQMQEVIRRLSSKLINPVYAAHVNVPTQINHLAAHCFYHGLYQYQPLLKQAMDLLQLSALDTEIDDSIADVI